MTLKARIDDAVKAIGPVAAPDVAIILGTGLGGLSGAIQAEKKVPYESLPHFARSTVASHKGDLVFGTLEGRRVVAMEGRFHAYEGYSMDQITFPVRVMRALGAKALIVSNACGGLNPSYGKGDLMLIDDHINLLGMNPLVGPNDESLGPRFPDMSRPYDREFLALAETIAAEEKIPARRGVYVALTGPCLETRAEYKFLRMIGADVVGMSTVPEVIVGVHGGFRILGVSIVTDVCIPETLEPVKVEEIIRVANEAEPRMTRLLRRFLSRVQV
ncbi:MAG TPA: purine-nucleoside phosphorylase [Planctomycetota bacterium]|nr:purine-nucleoside phosphorylase [Planctomycetota bacterium]